ncbi:AsmA-like C-terminal region-containing protein [Dyadobacter sp.]|uniref:AsmA-like C-terminal region-containing protein n=1 Tax=Dyadobacter sp. TaxID=1914288 RepID=UPI003F71D14E
MFARVLKIFGIVVLCAVFMFAAVEIWVDRNKERIFRSVQELVNENLNGTLEIEDFKFRPFYGGLGLNFTLSKVRLTDSLFTTHQKPFLEAELIHVALDLKGFYKGNIKIKNLVLQDGSLNLFTMRNGYSNLTIFQSGEGKDKKKKSGSNNIVEKFGHLRFINFGVMFADSVKKKYYGALFHDATNIVTVTDSTSNSSFKGAVLFRGLTFKPEKGGFLINQETSLDLSLAFDSENKKLKIYPSILESATHDKININGEFDFSDTIRKFRMNFSANQIEVDNALPLLTRKLRSQIDSLGVKAKVDTKVNVAGQLSAVQPRVDVKFETDTFKYDLPVGTLRQIKAFGTFTNQADTSRIPDVRNSALTAPKITGLFEKIPFHFKFSVKDFRSPRAVLEGHVLADSTNLGSLLDPDRYVFKKGTARIDFHFNGSLKNFYNAREDKFDGKITGRAIVNNIAMDYLPRKVHLSKIDGEFNFNEKAVVFQDLHFSDGQNMLYMRGKLIDLLPYLFGSRKPLRATVDINIPKWKLNWLENLFAARTNAPENKRRKLRLSQLLDNAIDQMEITAKLDTKELQYRQFTARDVKGEFTIKDNAVRIEYFVMKAFGKGSMRIAGNMDNSGRGQLPRMAVKGKIVNADVHSVFYSFDNFGQKAITSDNIKGVLNTDFKFEANLNNNVRLVPATMRGELSFDLSNGYIINFEPFMKMKRLIFKKRNFERVQFAPIRNNIRLVGQEIQIAPMEIESNVLTLYLDGVYSFGNKTDMNIQIPLSNLKKRDSTYVLDPNNKEKKDGSKIFLRAIDEKGEVNIKLAFRRRKDKNKQKDDQVEADSLSVQK